MSLLKIFVVEDEEITAKMYKYHLSLNPDNDVEYFTSGKDFLNNLYKSPDIVTLDYYLPGESCEMILDKILKYNSELPVIIVSGQQDVSTAVELLKKGAYDYVEKDENTKDRLWNIINNIRGQKTLVKRVVNLQAEVEEKYKLSNSLDGESPAIKKVVPLIEKASRSSLIVSNSGETGTGKEKVAKAIHYNSNRKDKPFIAINVAAIPGELIESELFGHEKGAFTGAISRKAGKFEEAQGGTIFLDEIGDMNPMMQAKLLRVLQEQELTRVGGNQIISLDVRVIVSTHKDLTQEVEKGNFREDLYYRLLGIPIHLQPLRERGNDVIILANIFIKDYCKANNIKPIKKLTSGSINKLMTHDFPGNVRELKAIVELGIVMSDEKEIDEKHLQIKYSSFFNELISTEMTLEEYNKLIVQQYLIKYNHKVREVAKKLGIGKSTIYRMFPKK